MSETILFVPKGGALPASNGLEAQINAAKDEGFSTLGMYALAAHKGFVVYAMLHEDKEMAATFLVPNPNVLPVIAISSFYPDGDSNTTLHNVDFAIAADPVNFMMPVPGENIEELVEFHRSVRKPDDRINVTVDNYQALAQKAFSRLANQLSGIADDSNRSLTAAEQQDAAIANMDDSIDDIVDKMIEEDPTLQSEFDDLVADLGDDDDDDFENERINEHLNNSGTTQQAEPSAPDMSLLEIELQELDIWYTANDDKIRELLRPGATADHIDSIEAGLDGFKLPQDVRALYQWHDGLDDDSLTYDLGNGRPFLSFQDALCDRNVMLESLPGVWQQNWLPIMGEADEGLLVILSREPRTHSGLYYYDLQSNPVKLHYTNVLTLIQTLREGFTSGVLKPVKDQDDTYYEVFQSDELKAIREKYNPATFPFNKTGGVTWFRWPDPESDYGENQV